MSEQRIKDAVTQVIMATGCDLKRLDESVSVVMVAIRDAMPGWQPIATAPKDGTTILVSVRGGHDGPYWVIFWNGNEWESSESGDFLQFHTELDYVWVTPPTPPEVQP